METVGTLSGLFREQAQAWPQRVAVRCEGRTASYAELDLWSDRLAAILSARGVGAGDCVLLCLDRSIELIVTLVAVQKMGAAYLPLQHDLPQRRREYIIRDAAPAAILVQPHLSGGFEAFGDRLLVVRPETYELASSHAAFRARPIHGRTPAYILYTSGSTGEPKAVVNEQQAIVNRLAWMRDHYALRESDVVLQKTPYTFDVSVWEFYLPLISGATLVLASPGGHLDIGYLEGLIDREGVTVLHFVPSMLNAFVEEAGDGGFRSVRQVVCSGEELTPALVGKFRRKFHAGARLANLYGPTEASIDASWFDCPSTFAGSRVPIGTPIWNTQLHIFDANLRAVTPGEPGALYIGGTGLASGYAARPALTAAKFIPDPHAAKPGQRLYATGDIARQLPDGNIVYLGRADDQVKINGQRIELGEIETHLQRHASVSAAVVVPHSVDGISQQLTAYVVPRGHTFCADTLKRYLTEELPPHMIPQVFMSVAHIPLTSSGKADRRKLPQPSAEVVTGGGVDVAHDAEAEITALWSKYLGTRPGVDRDRTFFELGGDSILAMRLVAALRRKGYVLTIRDLFEHRTLGRLVSRLRSVGQANGETGGRHRVLSRDEVLALRSGNQLDGMQLDVEERSALESCIRRSRFPLVAVSRVPSFVGRLLHDSMTTHTRELNLELVRCDFREVEVSALIDAWKKAVRQHEILRTQFCLGRAGAVFQIVYEDAALDCKVLDWRTKTREACTADFDRLLEHAWSKGVDLQSNCLMKLFFMCMPGGDVRMAWFQHHALTDGWSYHIVLEDVCRHLQAAEQPGDAAEPLQYRDFCNLLQAERRDASRKYWAGYLAGVRRETSLVRALGRGEAFGRTANARKEQRMDAAVLARLVEAAAPLQATLNAMFQAAWGILLSQRTGTEDVTFVSGVSLRQVDLPEIERVAGPLLNMLPVRLRADDSHSAAALVRQRMHELSLESDNLHGDGWEPAASDSRSSTLRAYDSIYAYESFPADLPENVTAFENHTRPRCPLVLQIWPGEQFTIQWFYDAAIFDAHQIDALMADFMRLLSRIAAAPHIGVGELKMGLEGRAAIREEMAVLAS